MTTLRQFLLCLTLAAATFTAACAGLALLEIRRVVAGADGFAKVAADLDKVVVSTNQVVTNVGDAVEGKHGLKQLIYNIDLATAQVARTSTTLEIVSKEEHAKALEASQELIASLADLREFVATTNEQVNRADGLLPTLTSDLQKTGAALDEISGPNGLLIEGTSAVKDAGAILSDPHIFETLAHVDSTMTHVDQGSDYAQQTMGFIRDDFNPKKKSFWENLAEKGLGAVPGGLIELLLHRFPQQVKVVK